MFWSGNYIVVRELNFLLKEENVSLAQVLEADDILQECKADNKALIQFLTKPEILSELVSLITEEPRPEVELTAQYRHASAACEVLTSQLAALADRLSLDATLMHRLCDFISREPPLNPLLASYFSKTVEMLLERSPKQDWYLYHIVCLRVLDFFKSRRDFLPNLLRHLATSAIADTFKVFVRLDDLFNKILMEWLEEHQVLESLIAVVCGTYAPEPLSPATPSAASAPAEGPEGRREGHGDSDGEREREREADNNNAPPPPPPPPPPPQAQAQARAEAEARADRLAAVASANAAALLVDLVLTGCSGEGAGGSSGGSRPRTAWLLVARLQSEPLVRHLLQGMFTSPPRRRPAALAHGATVLLALLRHEPILAGEAGANRSGVERALAPHLPLLHQALLTPPQPQPPQPPQPPLPSQPSEGDSGPGQPRAVGWARARVAALLAQLALSEADDVPTTMLTLGTPGVLCDMFFEYADNNFLHAEVYALVKHALGNAPYRRQYATHLLVECDLLTRLMDAFEDNENKKGTGRPRSGYMGHVVLLVRRLARALAPEPSGPAAEAEGPLAEPGGLLAQIRLPELVAQRWAAFVAEKVAPLAQQHDTPLGGYYPSENIYEADSMAESLGMDVNYELSEGGAELDEGGDDDTFGDDHHEMLGGPGLHGEDLSDVGAEKMASAQSCFLEMAQQRFGDDMWDDSPEGDAEGEGEGEGEAGRGGADVSEAPAAVRFYPVSPASQTSVEAWESGLGASCSASGSGSEGGEGGEGGEGWAHFGAEFGADAFARVPEGAFAAPVDPFAPRAPLAPRAPPAPRHADDDGDFTPFLSADTTCGGSPPAVPPPPPTDEAASRARLWPSDDAEPPCEGLSALRLEGCEEGGPPASASASLSAQQLASNLLTAMSAMTAADIANIVNANLPPPAAPPPERDGGTPDAAPPSGTDDHS